MTVVADATPIHYLVLIGEIDLLRELYGGVTVPEAVIKELSAPEAPEEVRAWVSTVPVWASVRGVPASVALPFASLGLGEREAIAIARESRGSILLTDDSQARIAAESVGLRVVPTLRVLSTAADLGFVELNDALGRLLQTNFRMSRKVIDGVLQRKSIES
jgi:predicted nucleic acid-binding protein